MDLTRALIAGFQVGGYRSFFGEPQFIAPLGQVTVVAGHNNSGKSNVIMAAAKWFAQVRARRMDPTMDTLDAPVLPEGEGPLPVSLGIALYCPRENAVESLMNALPNKPRKGTQDLALVEQIAQADALREAPVGDDHIWFKWVTSADRKSFTPDPTQIEALLTELAGQRRVLASITSSIFNGTAGDTENITRFLSSWRQKAVSIPEVVIVPAARDIVSYGEPHAELQDLNGRGLPQLLQTWQAPSADRHREDTRRFERINRFVRDVLEEPSAEITVPWDRGTIHVSLNDRVLPLSHLGKGVSQVVLLAAIATSYDKTLIGMEEPETNLHPVMIRKLIDYLATETSNQYILTTHSAHLLDNTETSIIRVTYNSTQGTTVQAAPSRAQRAAISQHLGYRASDILQSNAVVWVEGPSDRIYVRHWIKQSMPRLTEGIHYSIMFYGGRLLAHLTGEEWLDMPPENVDDFISILQINRRMYIIIDSDRKSEDDSINDTKKRVIDSFRDNGGIAWVTYGREIENYVPAPTLNRAMKEVHPTTVPAFRGGQFDDCFSTIRYKRGDQHPNKVKSPDKVRIAEEAIKDGSETWDVLDLRDRVSDLVHYLCEANDIPVPRVPETAPRPEG